MESRAWVRGPPPMTTTTAPPSGGEAAVPASSGATAAPARTGGGGAIPAEIAASGTTKAAAATRPAGIIGHGTVSAVAAVAETGVASAAPASGAVPSMIGMVISVRTRAGKLLTGELFTVAKGVAVIKEIRPHTYLRADVHIVNLASIIAVKLLGRSKDAIGITAALPSIDLSSIEARQAATMKVMESELEGVGDGVEPFAQALFDRLNRIVFNCSWDDHCIVVHNIVRVESPYRTENAAVVSRASNADQILTMVKKIVQRFWDARDSSSGAA